VITLNATGPPLQENHFEDEENNSLVLLQHHLLSSPISFVGQDKNNDPSILAAAEILYYCFHTGNDGSSS
jgi:hypothetical protein